MSRLTDQTRRWLPPKSARRLAYGMGLICAPLSVSLLFSWVPMFAVGSLYFGGLPYLLLAGPVFWIALRYTPPHPATFALIGFGLNMLSPLFFILVFLLFNISFNAEIFMILWRFGAVFASAWGAAFALLYRLFIHLLVAPEAPKGQMS